VRGLVCCAMINVINEEIQRTQRITGMPRDEIA
jgi:hypothetical protein